MIKNISSYIPGMKTATGKSWLSAILLLVTVVLIVSGIRFQNFSASVSSGEIVSAGLIPGIASPFQESGDTLRIHFISGSEQYESEKSLKMFKQKLENDYKFIKVTASWGEDAGDDLPNIEQLADADIMLVYTRRMKLPEDQLAYIKQHVEKEKPVIGLRTASHAFQGFLEFDNQILGGNYSNHGPEEPMKLSYAEGAENHSVLSNVKLWGRPDKIYFNPDLGQNSTVLLYGRGADSDVNEPMAWTNRYGKNGRSFYAGMGYPTDFENESFINLLINAIEWTSQRKINQIQ